MFVVLAGMAAGMVALLGLLPAAADRRRRGAAPARYREALRRPGVPALLLVVVAYMAAFYGSYGYLGDHVRALHGSGAAAAGLIALAYGIGFGAAGLVDGRLDDAGPARLLAPVVVALAGCYALLPAAAARVPVLLALAVAWGFANHAGLNLLVTLLARRGGDARGPVMALYSGATYLAASLATAGLGPVYELAGFAPVAAAGTAALLLAAVPATRLRTPRPQRPARAGGAPQAPGGVGAGR